VKTEPLTIIGSIGSIIGAFIVLMQSFGIPITDDQSNAINNFVVIAAPLIVALIGRQFVFSPTTAEKMTEDAYRAALPPTEPKPPVADPPGTLHTLEPKG